MARQARRIGVEIDADVEQRKLIIFEEAARAFAENGIQYTSVSDIAKRLNIAKPSVYHYISGKDALIDGILDIAHQRVAPLRRAVEQAGPTAIDRLRALMREIVKRAASDPFTQCTARIDRHSLKPQQRERHRALQRDLVGYVARIIQEGIDEGSIKPCNPTLQSFSLLGSVINVTRWYDSTGPFTLDEIAGQIAQPLLDGLSSIDS